MKAYKVKTRGSDMYLCRDQNGWFYSPNPNHVCVMIYEGEKAWSRVYRLWANSSRVVIVEAE